MEEEEALPIKSRVEPSLKIEFSVERSGKRDELPQFDGRPLHQFPLSSSRFTALHAALRREAQSGRLFSRTNAGAFIWWASHWMRHTHRGGTRKWGDLDRALGVQWTQQQWRSLTDTGLQVCRRDVLVHNGVALRLTTLAREGGFPIAAVESGAAWPKRYLALMVSRLVSGPNPTVSQSVHLAEEFQHVVPSTWRGEELTWLAADLALAIANLRQIADGPAGHAELLSSEWLEQNVPDWKLRLPIAMETEAAASLIDSLMKVVPATSSVKIGADRIIRRKNGVWTPGIELDLNGTFSLENIPNPAGIDRMRLFSAGRFAVHCAGELAVIERDDEASVWSSRSSKKNSAFDCPIGVAVECEVRQDATIISRLLLPGGRPLGAGPLLCTTPTGEPVEDLLNVVGTVSGCFAASTVYALLPQGWHLRPCIDDESVEDTGNKVLESQMFEIRGGAVLESPDGDLHRIRTGQAGNQRDDLELWGNRVGRLVAAKPDEEIFAGSPIIQISEGDARRRPRDGELFLREVGSRVWRPFRQSIVSGYFDIAWKDSETGHIRAKRRFALLPSSSTVEVHKSGASITVNATGMTNLTIPAPFEMKNEGCWRIEANYRSRAIAAKLHWPLASLDVRIHTIQDPCIAFWNDQCAEHGQTFSVAALGSLVACCDYSVDLIAELYDRDKQAISGATLRWRVDGELSFAAIKDDLKFLLTSKADIDGLVRLRFNTAFEEYWYVRLFGESFKKTGRKLHILPVERTVITSLVGRCLPAPFEEHEFEHDVAAAGTKLVNLPVTATGLWLLYLRAGSEVITRPEVQLASGRGAVPANILAHAMAPADRRERLRLIDQLFAEMTVEAGAAFDLSKCLVELVYGLNGLPPATFDILQRASETPDILALMALAAPLAKRPAVRSLADSLPFCWSALPKKSWDRAASHLANYFFDTLGDLPQAPFIVGQEISLRRMSMASMEPGLSAVLGVSTKKQSSKTIVQVFLNRNADSLVNFDHFQFKDQSVLPKWDFDPAFLPILQAPAVAVLAANGGYMPNEVELRVVRSVTRLYPDYFGDAINSFFGEHTNGGW